MFYSFDGLDGTGKSTQLKLFADWLRSRGHDVVTCVDPGSTRLGEAIRQILLESKDTPISATSEMLLFMAARAQLVEEVIRPALQRGKVVVSDRFLLANVVYQGYAGGLDVATLWKIGETATGGIHPTRTFVLDMPADAATARIGRAFDRMESHGSEYREKLRTGFLAEAARRPEIVVINAAQSIEAVHATIVDNA
jgi:dTMP kinase